MNIYLFTCYRLIFTTERENWIMWIKNITKHKLFKKLYKPNMTDLQMLGNSFCEFGLVSTYQRFSTDFDQKMHLFENRLLKMLVQIYKTMTIDYPVVFRAISQSNSSQAFTSLFFTYAFNIYVHIARINIYPCPIRSTYIQYTWSLRSFFCWSPL